MKIYTLIRWDRDLQVVEAHSHEYDGPVALLKASAEEKALAAQQAAFYSQLTSLFTQQFNTQKQTLDFLSSYLKPLISNPQGYDKEALTSMRTTASDTIATQYNNATKAAQNREFVLGGRQAPGGAQLQLQNELEASHAATEASAQNQITQANENLKLTQFWNAISALSGVGGMQNPSYLASSANEAGANAFQSAYTISQQNSFANSMFGQLLSGAIGGGLDAFTGGMGSKLSGKMFG